MYLLTSQIKHLYSTVSWSCCICYLLKIASHCHWLCWYWLLCSNIWNFALSVSNRHVIYLYNTSISVYLKPIFQLFKGSCDCYKNQNQWFHLEGALKFFKIGIFLDNLWRFCIKFIKGTNVFSSDLSGLPCLMQLYTRLHLSDYPKFGNTDRSESSD